MTAVKPADPVERDPKVIEMQRVRSLEVENGNLQTLAEERLKRVVEARALLEKAMGELLSGWFEDRKALAREIKKWLEHDS